jgi:hypothetical protein
LIDNIVAWAQVRKFLKDPQGMLYINIVIGSAIVTVAILCLGMVVRLFLLQQSVSVVDKLIMFEVVVLSLYVIAIVLVGALINKLQEEHPKILYKQQVSLVHYALIRSVEA